MFYEKSDVRPPSNVTRTASRTRVARRLARIPARWLVESAGLTDCSRNTHTALDAGVATALIEFAGRPTSSSG
jgi:hypothetical protein